MTLADTLAGGQVLAMVAEVRHARRGPLRHAFQTRADFILFQPERFDAPTLLSKNRFNLTSWRVADHGGARGRGTGTLWAWEQFATLGLGPRPGRVLALLTQPRFLGFWFNPVSFWMLLDGNDLTAVIAEVNNTFGQRHSYLLAKADHAPLRPEDRLSAEKCFHVSPFQDVSGRYDFRFNVTPERIAIQINQIDGTEGVETAMAGPLAPLTNRGILWAAVCRPGGALRVVAQIYSHALRLRLKGAAYRPLPLPPEKEIS